jgi:trk system potassium uptake protein TrkA
MKIIICGIGKLGRHLANTLVKEDHTVTLIDNDSLALQEVVNNLDVNYVEGNALDSEILIEAGIENTDLLISVMIKDEQNIMCSLLAKKLGVKNTIARIRTPEYTKSIDLVKEELGLSMVINPEALTAEQIATTLSIPSAIEATSFLKGKINLISIKVKENSKLVNQTISSIAKKLPKDLLICAIERNNETIIPKGTAKILEGDKVSITGSPNSIKEFLKFAKLYHDKTKKVIICGGSSTGEYLAKKLEGMDMDITLIDINPERCQELSEKLPETLIINADASDQDVLFEEGIQRAWTPS